MVYEHVIAAWMLGFSLHAVMHFLVIPTAPRLWDWAFGV